VAGQIQAAEPHHERNAISLLEAGLRVAIREKDSRWMALAHLLLGEQLVRQRRAAEGRAHLEQALGLAERLGPDTAGRVSDQARAALENDPASLDTESLERSAEQATRQGDVLGAAEIHLELGRRHFYSTDHERAARHLLRFIAIRSKTHQVSLVHARTVRDTPQELSLGQMREAMGLLVTILVDPSGHHLCSTALAELAEHGLERDTRRYLRRFVLERLAGLRDQPSEALTGQSRQWFIFALELLGSATPDERVAGPDWAVDPAGADPVDHWVFRLAHAIATTVLPALRAAQATWPELPLEVGRTAAATELPVLQCLAAAWLAEDESHLGERLDTLADLARSPSPVTQDNAASALELLAPHDPPAALERLDLLARDRQERVRRNAARALTVIGRWHRAEALSALSRLRSDPSPMVRAAVRESRKALRRSLLKRLLGLTRHHPAG
jgi:hypothetical protein